MTTTQPDPQPAGDAAVVAKHGIFIYEITYAPDDVWRGIRLDQARKLIDQLERVKLATFMVGRSLPSEDDLIQQGINFGDYERGVNDAVEVIAKRIAKTLSAVECRPELREMRDEAQ